jgi:hypothetical protein
MQDCLDYEARQRVLRENMLNWSQSAEDAKMG